MILDGYKPIIVLLLNVLAHLCVTFLNNVRSDVVISVSNTFHSVATSWRDSIKTFLKFYREPDIEWTARQRGLKG